MIIAPVPYEHRKCFELHVLSTSSFFSYASSSTLHPRQSVTRFEFQSRIALRLASLFFFPSRELYLVSNWHYMCMQIFTTGCFYCCIKFKYGFEETHYLRENCKLPRVGNYWPLGQCTLTNQGNWLCWIIATNFLKTRAGGGGVGSKAV